jgi:hypothetical protein
LINDGSKFGDSEKSERELLTRETTLTFRKKKRILKGKIKIITRSQCYGHTFRVKLLIIFLFFFDLRSACNSILENTILFFCRGPTYKIVGIKLNALKLDTLKI